MSDNFCRAQHDSIVPTVLLLHLPSEPFILGKLRDAEDTVWILPEAFEAIMRRVQEKESPYWHEENKGLVDPGVFRVGVSHDEIMGNSAVGFSVHPLQIPRIFC